MSSSDRPDIRPPEAIDAKWLTAILRQGGVDAVVDGFEARDIGNGMFGTSICFSLSYSRKAEGAPTSLVGKFPSRGQETLERAMQGGSYVREVRFYQQLAPTARIEMPRCWFADVDAKTHQLVLLMEDLAPAEPGDQLKGVTLDQARSVIIEAAKLHASHWGDAGLLDLPWMVRARIPDDRMISVWNTFKEQRGSGLPAEWLALGDRVAANYGHLTTRNDGPRCLTHNDFRPDNMMFASAKGGRPATVLDWQSFGYGVGATDLAYFMAGALTPELRRAAEPEFLELYLRTLTEEGVSGYGMADLKRHYGQGAYLLFVTAFFCAVTLTPTLRGDQMFMQMLASAAEHMLDHDPLNG